MTENQIQDLIGVGILCVSLAIAIYLVIKSEKA